jgi:hypothetical protein
MQTDSSPYGTALGHCSETANQRRQMAFARLPLVRFFRNFQSPVSPQNSGLQAIILDRSIDPWKTGHRQSETNAA